MLENPCTTIHKPMQNRHCLNRRGVTEFNFVWPNIFSISNDKNFLNVIIIDHLEMSNLKDNYGYDIINCNKNTFYQTYSQNQSTKVFIKKDDDLLEMILIYTSGFATTHVVDFKKFK